MAQSFPTVQQERNALTLGKVFDRALDPTSALPGLQDVTRRIVVDGKVGVLQRHGRPLQATLFVQTEVDDDAVEPCCEFRTGFKSRDGPMDAEEGLLADVLGEVPPAHKAVGQREDVILVASDEFGQGLGAPVSIGGHQLLVGESGKIHGGRLRALPPEQNTSDVG